MKRWHLALFVSLSSIGCSAEVDAIDLYGREALAEGNAGDPPAGDVTRDSDSSCSDGREALCGNGRTDGAEACDPSAPAYSTFNCSEDCEARKIYDVCTSARPFDQADCGEGYVCGGYGTGSGIPFCIPIARSVEDCPPIAGYAWVIAGLGVECLIPCTPDGQGFPTDPRQCPAITNRCFTNPFALQPEGWCSR
jgi:hypothetical protein